MNVLRRMIFERLQVDCVQVIVHLGYPGLVVPDFVRKGPPTAEAQAVILDYGYGLPRPPAVTLDDRGITATLSFNGVDHPTFVPWAAIIILRTVDDTFVAGFAVDPTLPQEPPPEPPRRGLKSV